MISQTEDAYWVQKKYWMQLHGQYFNTVSTLHFFV
jgi:hypothetical protein